MRAYQLAELNHGKLTVVDVVKHLPPLLDRMFVIVADDEKNEAESIKQAEEQARQEGATLKVVPDVDHALKAIRKNKKKLQRSVTLDRYRQLKDFIGHLDQGKAKVKIKTLVGKPIIELVREINRGSYHLVMKAADQNKGLFSFFRTNMDSQLLRMSPIPVWIKKVDHHNKYKRILAAIEPGHEGEEHPTSKTILKLAANFAESQGCELIVLHVWRSGLEDFLKTGGQKHIPVSNLDKKVAELRKEHESWLNKQKRKYKDAKCKMKFLLKEGDPEEEIIELANQSNVDLIITGTTYRSGVEEFITSTVTEVVMHHTTASILAVKHKGYEVPIDINQRLSP